MWSRDQERALSKAGHWLRRPERQLFRLFGYAGTGKTTLAYEIGHNHQHVVYAAFTGKAAHVLRQLGCRPATTIHGLIYIAVEDPETGQWGFRLRPRHELRDTVALIVIDECSMVGDRLALDLMSFGIPILALGDPAQLPPIGDDADFLFNSKPDIMLTQIHRQAADNPIIKLSDRVRRGERLPLPGYRAGGVLRILNGLNVEMANYDVRLVGLNDTRGRLNWRMRRHLGHVHGGSSKDPQAGEVAVCLRNDYSGADPVFNGSLWNIETAERGAERKLPIMRLALRSADNGHSRTNVRVPAECFSRDETKYLPGLQQFGYGYALTVHKAQGSAWKNVLMINEARCFRQHARRWLYTGITRASDQLTIVDYR